jgi:RNA polymerase sigma-70 factor (ECF subfamily)
MSPRASFEQVALPHMAAAFNLARHILGQRADAEDAVQDAYVRAYRAYHQLESQDIKPWLLTIVRNVCYRRLQQRRRANNVISLDEAINPGAAGEYELHSGLRSPEEAAIGASEQTLVSTAIADLPPAFREVIVLREIEELSYREIADVIGAPVGTVMSRLARARSQLKARLSRLLDRDESDAM